MQESDQDRDEAFGHNGIFHAYMLRYQSDQQSAQWLEPKQYHRIYANDPSPHGWGNRSLYQGIADCKLRHHAEGCDGSKD